MVLQHGEFKAYGDRVRQVFDGWRREHAPRLRELAVGHAPKALIRDLSEDLLHRFAGLPLLDRYDVYQCLMDYWDEVMQDDVYLVVTEGWAAAARPRVLVPVKGKGTAEPPDLTVNRKKYRMDLVPPGLVVTRGFATEQAEVDRLRTEEERIARELEEFVEEYSGEDGLLEGATSDAGKVTQAAVKARLKEVVGDPEGQEERDVLEVCLDLMKALAAAKRVAKAAQARLNSKVLARYATLTAAEITELVVGDKWMASVEGAIGQVVERLTGGLVDRVRVLEGRYAKPLPELARQVEDYGAKVEGPPGADGAVGMSRQFGWFIVEYEQNGIDRAEYGTQLLSRMAERFRHAGIRGASTTSLKRFRRSPTRPAEFVQRCWTNPDTRAPSPWWMSSLASEVSSPSAGPTTSPSCP